MQSNHPRYAAKDRRLNCHSQAVKTTLNRAVDRAVTKTGHTKSFRINRLQPVNLVTWSVRPPHHEEIHFVTQSAFSTMTSHRGSRCNL
jgi:hypothetical protein